MATERPFGVVILAILQVLGALGLLGLGGLLVAGAGFIGLAAITEIPELAGVITGILVAVGAFMLLLGIISLVVAWGLWTGQGWAWIVCLILTIISLILSIPGALAGVGIIGIIIDIVIIYYLTRPHVKAFFGKGPPPEAPPPPPP
jgi:uncharacterized membrane protein (DUF2068 family)